MNEPVKTLMVGCGNMGSALLGQWAKLPGFRFTVVDRNGTKVPAGLPVFADLNQVVDQDFGLVILGVKPQQIESISEDLKKQIGPKTVVLSMAAGTSLKALSSLLGAVHVVRMMPNLPVKIGLGVVGLYEEENSKSCRNMLSALGDAAGLSVWTQSEKELDVLTVLTGCGPGFIFETMRAFVSAGQHIGIDEEVSTKMALQTFLGTVQMAIDSKSSLEALREAVTSKNGVTEAGLVSLRGGAGLEPLMKKSFSDALTRIEEMAKS